MNKINQLFQQGDGRKLLSLYFCAGSPTLEGTARVILTLQRRGVDMVEVGIPFSDPLADGPVIQQAGTEALANAIPLAMIFGQRGGCRGRVDFPLVLMGSLNVVGRYGRGRFFRGWVATGVGGCIIPDLLFRDYLGRVKPLADRHDVRVIMMITPETSEERVRLIDRHTDGFIYMVSSASTTGTQGSFGPDHLAYFDRVEAMGLRNPRMIGFGIGNRQTLALAQGHAAGAIIGSKFVSLLRQEGDPDKALDLLFDALNH